MLNFSKFPTLIGEKNSAVPSAFLAVLCFMVHFMTIAAVWKLWPLYISTGMQVIDPPTNWIEIWHNILFKCFIILTSLSAFFPLIYINIGAYEIRTKYIFRRAMRSLFRFVPNRLRPFSKKVVNMIGTIGLFQLSQNSKLIRVCS